MGTKTRAVDELIGTSSAVSLSETLTVVSSNEPPKIKTAHGAFPGSSSTISIRGQAFGLGTTEIGLNYRRRNNLPMPTVPPQPPGAKCTPHVNFVDPEFSKVLESAEHPIHDHALEFYLHLALNHEVSLISNHSRNVKAS